MRDLLVTDVEPSMREGENMCVNMCVCVYVSMREGWNMCVNMCVFF